MVTYFLAPAQTCRCGPNSPSILEGVAAGRGSNMRYPSFINILHPYPKCNFGHVASLAILAWINLINLCLFGICEQSVWMSLLMSFFTRNSDVLYYYPAFQAPLLKEGELGLPAPAVRAKILFVETSSNTITCPRSHVCPHHSSFQPRQRLHICSRWRWRFPPQPQRGCINVCGIMFPRRT